MPWNEADRAKYDVIRARYSSDLSDAEFALIFALLPAPKRRGRKPTCAREILNALFYLIRAGCPWRLLPKDFPPFTTVPDSDPLQRAVIENSEARQQGPSLSSSSVVNAAARFRPRPRRAQH